MKRKLPLSTPSSFYPPLDNNPNAPAGLDLVQTALQDSIAAIMYQLTGNPGPPILLIGASVTIAGGNYSTTPGWVWYNGDAGGVGELLYLPAIGTTSMGGKTYLNASISMDPNGANPITYSDGTPQSPHVNRIITLTPGNSPSSGAYSAATGSLPYGLITTLPDATTWIPFSSAFVNSYKDTPLVVGASGQPAYGTGYSQSNRLAFWKSAGGIVHIQGDFESAGTDSSAFVLFTLPSGYRPTTKIYGFFITQDASNYSSYKGNTAYTLAVNTDGTVHFDGAGGVGALDNDGFAVVIPPFATN